MRAFVEAGTGPGVRQRHGARAAARRPRARVLARPVARVEGSRPRARRGDPARLPARLRAVRRRAGRRTCATPRSQVAAHATLAASTAGDLAATFAALAESGAPPARTTTGSRSSATTSSRSAPRRSRRSTRTRRRSSRRAIYGELRKRLDRDAIVIGDGGDFVSYAGKLRRQLRAGNVPRPGPVRMPGMGPGYALAAAIAHPDRQIVLLLGDGAIGFALGDFEALARHGVNVVAIVGNNGIWGLEKHPMQALFGYDVVAELSPGIRYDQVVEALGGHGELVTEPGRARPRARPRVRDARRLAGERPHRPRRRLPPVAATSPDQNGRGVRGRGSGFGADSRRGAGPWPSCAGDVAWRRRRCARPGSLTASPSCFGRHDFADQVHRERFVGGELASADRRARGRPRRRRDRAAGRRRRRRTCARDGRSAPSSTRCAGRTGSRGRSRRRARDR